MSSKVSQCYLWSDERLIHDEVTHKRAIASYVTGLTLTTATGLASFETTAPIVIPIAGFKAYKIRSHFKKLKIIRAELARRNLSTKEKKKRDMLIPITTTAAVYFVCMSIARVADFVPDALQIAINAPFEESFSLSDEMFFAAGNKYEAFIAAEIAEIGLKKRTEQTNYYDVRIR